MINLKLTRWIVVASLTWVFGCTFNRYYESEVQWIKSIYEKKVELARSTKAQRRLLIVGGSGTHFGVDTQQIEQELDIPVFNMGLHAGLGLNAILATVLDEIRSGDIVLLIPEYDLIMANDGTGYYSSSFGAAVNRPGIGGVDSEEVVREIMLMGVPGSDRILQKIKGLQRTFSSTDTDNADTIKTSVTRKEAYSERNIDKRGNPIVLPIGNPRPAHIKHSNISEYSSLRLQVFRNQVEEAEATLVLALPWVLVKSKEENLQKIQAVENDLNEIADVIHDEEFNLKNKPKLFGDTNYHMSYHGRQMRSSAMEQQLKHLFKAKENFFTEARKEGAS